MLKVDNNTTMKQTKINQTNNKTNYLKEYENMTEKLYTLTKEGFKRKLKQTRHIDCFSNKQRKTDRESYKYKEFCNNSVFVYEYTDMFNETVMIDCKEVDINNIVKNMKQYETNSNKQQKTAYCEKIEDKSFKLFLDIRNIKNKCFNVVYNLINDFKDFISNSNNIKSIKFNNYDMLYDDYYYNSISITYNKKLRDSYGESFYIIFNNITLNIDNYNKILNKFLSQYEIYKEYINNNYSNGSIYRLPYYYNRTYKGKLLDEYYDDDVYKLAKSYLVVGDNGINHYVIEQYKPSKININKLKETFITLIPKNHMCLIYVEDKSKTV